MTQSYDNWKPTPEISVYGVTKNRESCMPKPVKKVDFFFNSIANQIGTKKNYSISGSVFLLPAERYFTSQTKTENFLTNP